MGIKRDREYSSRISEGPSSKKLKLNDGTAGGAAVELGKGAKGDGKGKGKGKGKGSKGKGDWGAPDDASRKAKSDDFLSSLSDAGKKKLRAFLEEKEG